MYAQGELRTLRQNVSSLDDDDEEEPELRPPVRPRSQPWTLIPVLPHSQLKQACLSHPQPMHVYAAVATGLSMAGGCR